MNTPLEFQLTSSPYNYTNNTHILYICTYKFTSIILLNLYGTVITLSHLQKENTKYSTHQQQTKASILKKYISSYHISKQENCEIINIMEVVSILGEMKGKMNFEETELRLGLPGNNISKVKNNIHVNSSATNVNGKRGFVETTNVDLKLNLVVGHDGEIMDQAAHPTEIKNLLGGGVAAGAASTDSVVKPPAKAQVVGWPPVRSYRKNVLSLQKAANKKGDEENEKVSSPMGATFVKVSLDGAPYLRKVDLKMYKSYQELSDALGNMFNSFTIGNCGSQGMMDFMNESKLMDLLNNSDYVPTYEDKDGDWMLVGDVPWEMFVGSCKRLRIMKGTEAVGLAPRAMEKCKNRT